MESGSALIFKEGPSRRNLNPFRAIRGLFYLIILPLTVFTFVVYFAFWAAVPLRFFSVHYSRRATSFFFGILISLWPFFFEKINGTKFVFSGDTVPAKERVVLIANHTAGMDWVYLWDLAVRKGRASYIKYILKSGVMNLPIIGWAFHLQEYIPVARKWEADEQTLPRMLSDFVDPRDPLWLVVFPEGTNFTEERCIRSQKYASEKGLPILRNLLLPKTKGFYACLQTLRGSLDAVYDITIGYRHHCPSVFDILFGVEPSEVHIHVQRIPLRDLPASEDQVTSWLMNAFSLKDEMLSDFYSGGNFPHERTEGELSTLKCLGNFIFTMILTGTCIYLTFFSSIWFKLYALLVCVYMVLATYFHVRPSPICSRNSAYPQS